MCTRAKRRLNPFSFVFLAILVWQFGSPAFAQSQPQVDLTGKNILILHALEANMPLNMRTNQAIIAALEAGGIGMRNQFFEYLDLQRNPSSEHRKRLAEMMHLRYGERKIDVIITLYPEALEFLLKDCQKIFPQAPIVALYMAPGFELPKTDHRIIQYVFRCDMKGTLEIALKLVPKAKRVYVVGGVHSLDKKNEAQARQDFKKWEDQLTFRYLSDMSLEETLAMVSSAPAKTIIFYMAMTGDITGKTYNPRDVAERLRQVSNGPVFGLYETLLGYGIVGGSIVSYRDIGTQAGTLALSFLGFGSDSNKTSKVLNVPGVPMFDWRELRRWNLNEGALPKGSIVINRELTLWDFKYYILGGIAILLAQTALVIGLLMQRRKKERAEESLKQRTEELDQFFHVTLDLLGIANTDGYFLRLNPAMERILGYSREEIMAKRFFEFVHPDDLDRTREAVSTLTSQQKIASFENRYRCKDGTYRWLEWSSAPVGNLIYAAARDVTERRQYEQTLRENERALLQNENDLRQLTGRLISAQEEERRHLARELHDDLSQRLAVLSIDAGKLEQQLMSSPGPIKEKLKEMKNQVVKISGDVHNLARQLHPSILDDLGLVRAIESECDAFSRREGINIVFSHDNISNIAEKDVSLTLYRLAQEGLRNISKHACANHISVSLKGVDQDVLLSIQDDGIGFDLTEARVTPGLGLSSLAERVRLIKGELLIKSQPGEGTMITVRVPLNDTAEGFG